MAGSYVDGEDTTFDRNDQAVEAANRALTITESISKLVSEMESVEVKDQEQYDWMVAWLRRNKDTQKVVDDFFEADRVKAKAAYDKVLSDKAAFKRPLENADAAARRKMTVFSTEREKARRAAQEAADAEAKKLKEDENLRKAEELSAMGRDKKADDLLSKAVVVHAAPVAPKVGRTVEVWTVEVVDLCAFLAEASGLPLVADCVEVKVTALAALLKKNNTKTLAGLKIEQTFRPVL